VTVLQPPRRFRALAAILASLLLLGVSAATAATSGSGREPAEALRSSLGLQGVVDVDPLTGTPRVVARLDGFLTEPSGGDGVDLVLDYVRANERVFMLDEDDLAGLRLVGDQTDAAGVRHLLWAQTAGGIPAFDNDLRASVTADGRILNVLGSPLPDLALPPEALSVGGGEAVTVALRDAGHPVARAPRALAVPRGAARATRFAGGHSAGLVLVNDGRGVRLAWRVTANADSDAPAGLECHEPHAALLSSIVQRFPSTTSVSPTSGATACRVPVESYVGTSSRKRSTCSSFER